MVRRPAPATPVAHPAQSWMRALLALLFVFAATPPLVCKFLLSPFKFALKSRDLLALLFRRLVSTGARASLGPPLSQSLGGRAVGVRPLLLSLSPQWIGDQRRLVESCTHGRLLSVHHPAGPVSLIHRSNASARAAMPV